MKKQKKCLNKKTILLIRNVQKNAFGGGEVYQIMLAEALAKVGYEPIVVSSSQKLIELANEKKIKTVRAPYLKQQNFSGWRNVLLPLYFLWQLYLMAWYKKIFEEYTPSVIDVQSRDDMIAATIVARRAGIKTLWTDHADFYNWVLINTNKKFKNMIGKKIIRLSKDVDAVIFVSENLRKMTEKMISPRRIENVKVVNNGVRDAHEKYKNVKIEGKSFVYVGRVVKEKGVVELVRAFMDVLTTVPDATLSLYGDGPTLRECKEIARGCENITFNGYLDNPVGAIASKEVFVLPSYREGLSLSLLEAAMMGKIIIATDVGGNSEVVVDGETGILVRAKDEKGLAQAMLKVINGKNMNAMAKRARKLYEDKFDFDKIVSEDFLPLIR